MRIKLINPNTTGLFTERLAATARTLAAAGTEVFASNPMPGTPSVESHVDEAIAAMGVIAEVEAGEAAGMDAYVIACFGDTGVAAAREVARGPVVGMTEAAYFSACLVAATFSVITLPPRTLIHARRVLHDCGMTWRCAGLRAIEMGVSDCRDDADSELYHAMKSESLRALEEDRCEAIVLGCAGLSHLVKPLQMVLGVPVIDGVGAALKMAESLVTLGLGTSKRCSYASPPRQVRGIFA